MATVLLIAHILGIASSFDSLMRTRTSQGALAWIVALNTFPLLAVPAYWIFGRTKFHGYRTLRQQVDVASSECIGRIRDRLRPFVRDVSASHGALAGAQLAKLDYLTGNAVELLVDGHATFDSILAGIDAAKEYVLVQFYIIHADGIGMALKERLIAKAKGGVKVWLLYDEIGSKDLPATYLDALRAAGVRVSSFHSTRGVMNRFQLNFRNHRKIVVADGAHGWVGGLNVGDEYLGKSERLPNWRDTHVKISGPAVLELQIAFIEDWRWATDELLDLPCSPGPVADGKATVLILPTGPADRLESASLMYQAAIHAAKRRIWIASPYFIPDEGVLGALHLAALGGIDVRVVIPDRSDRRIVHYGAYAFAGSLIESGVRIFRYQPGFLHEKVFLVDDDLAGIGTTNLDNRSFRLNFEVTALIHEPKLIGDVARMFESDFSRSREMTFEEVRTKPIVFRALARASYLLAPIQ
jgi:cardiolipin synthase